MKISNLLADDAILAEIGQRITRRRLDLQMTQAAVAEQAGIAKRTLERLEAGQSMQLSNLIRILRVLESLPGLDHMLPGTGPRPMDLLKRKGKPRQRASGSRRSDQHATPWTWDEEA
jgi:transcriptional regulator with XRE-family HTH domain